MHSFGCFVQLAALLANDLTWQSCRCNAHKTYHTHRVSSFASDLTHNTSFWRQVFPSNHLHWYWQLKTTTKYKKKPQNKPTL